MKPWGLFLYSDRIRQQYKRGNTTFRKFIYFMRNANAVINPYHKTLFLQ